MQENCDIAESNNLVIYGHHIKGGKMFGTGTGELAPKEQNSAMPMISFSMRTDSLFFNANETKLALDRKSTRLNSSHT